MGNQHWLFFPLTAALLISLAGCGKNENQALVANKVGGSVEQQFDTHKVDVNGDGDRALFSGANDLNNPPVRVEALPHGHAGSPVLREGRYAGNGFADRIAQLALSAPHVMHSVAVTSGTVAIIGLGLKHDLFQPKGLSSKDELGLKQEIRRRVLVQAPSVRFVYVTTNRQQVAELSRIADGLRAGHPISLYTERIHALMHSMQPVPWG